MVVSLLAVSVPSKLILAVGAIAKWLLPRLATVAQRVYFLDRKGLVLDPAFGATLGIRTDDLSRKRNIACENVRPIVSKRRRERHVLLWSWLLKPANLEPITQQLSQHHDPRAARVQSGLR